MSHYGSPMAETRAKNASTQVGENHLRHVRLPIPMLARVAACALAGAVAAFSGACGIELVGGTFVQVCDGGTTVDGSPPLGRDGSTDAGGNDAQADGRGPDGGRPCGPGQTRRCDVGSYCDAPGCMVVGECKVVDADAGGQLDAGGPVCGCDGVTYWNLSAAQDVGAAIGSTGRCAAPDAAACDGAGTCPDANTKCGIEQQLGCSGPKRGLCWRIPKDCPRSVGAAVHTCAADGGCTSLCDAIKSEKPYYVGASCTVVP